MSDLLTALLRQQQEQEQHHDQNDAEVVVDVTPRTETATHDHDTHHNHDHERPRQKKTKKQKNTKGRKSNANSRTTDGQRRQRSASSSKSLSLSRRENNSTSIGNRKRARSRSNTNETSNSTNQNNTSKNNDSNKGKSRRTYSYNEAGEHDDGDDDSDGEEIEVTFDDYESSFFTDGAETNDDVGNVHNESDDEDDGVYSYGHRNKKNSSSTNDSKRRRVASGKAVSQDPFYMTYPNILKVVYSGGDNSVATEQQQHSRLASSSPVPKQSSTIVDDTNNDDDESTDRDVDDDDDDYARTRSRNGIKRENSVAIDQEILEDEQLEIIQNVLHPRPTELVMTDQIDDALNEGDDEVGGGNTVFDGEDSLYYPKKQLVDGVGSSTKVSKSLTDRYLPRRKRYFVPKTTLMKSGAIPSGPGPNYAVYRLETSEDVQQRVESLQRSEQIFSRHTRWKRRKLNLQDDDDVGQAFAARADTYLKDRLIKEKKQSRIFEYKLERKRKRIEEERQRQEQEQQRKDEEEQYRRQEKEDKLEDDDSFHEQNYLLSQLTENSGGGGGSVATKEASHALSSKSKSTIGTAVTSTKSLTYWEDGYAVPSKEYLDYNYNPSIEQVMNNPSNGKVDDTDDEDDKNGTAIAHLSSLTNTASRNHADSFYYISPNRPQNGQVGFNCHVRQMIVMAARSLCGHPCLRKASDDDAASTYLEDRYVRLLLGSSKTNVYAETRKNERVDHAALVNVTSDHFLALYANELGKNVLLYTKNIWNDAKKVVHRLGLTIDSNESPLTAVTFSKKSLITNFKNVRLKVKSDLQTCSRNWSFAGSVTDSATVMPMEKNDGDSSSNPNKNSALPDVPTSDGVFNVRSRSSIGMLEESVFTHPRNDNQDILITPNCLWAHIPGTDPPIPQTPLDPLGILFGPSDRYSKFHRGNARISLNSLNLILSTLLQRASMRVNNPKKMAETQHQIMTLLCEYIDVHTNELYIRLNHYSTTSTNNDIPLVYLFYGLTCFCSFMASGCASLETDISGEDDANSHFDHLSIKKTQNHMRSEDDDVNASSGRDQEGYSAASDAPLLHRVGMHKVAEKIWDFCRIKISLNGILRFPKLRVTFAIASICKSLPPSAAEILSRPLDATTTPLDLFKETLLHIENNKMIHESSHYVDGENIHVGELEYIIHDAADTLHEAVRLDCLNSDYHQWYIGCLASCLLLSSGNKISERASVFPSQKASHNSSFGPVHEIRARLKRYADVRCELAAAMSLLLELTSHQQSSRAHLGVASFLEWSQVVALLVGRTIENKLDSIQRVHCFHMCQWSAREIPAATISLPSEPRSKVSNVGLYARQLENDPTNIDHWKELIRHLGPIPKPQSDRFSQSNAGRSPKWWGEGREWWLTSLLYVPALNRTSVEEKQVDAKREQLLSAFGGIEEINDVDRNSSSNTDGLCDSMIEELSDQDRKNDWLPSISDIEADDIGENASMQERSTCFLNDLPQPMIPSRRKSMASAKAQQNRHGRANMDVVDDDSFPTASNDAEILAYKIFVAGHLVGVDHEVVRNGLDSLTDALDGSDCTSAVVWLASKGLRIQSLLCR